MFKFIQPLNTSSMPNRSLICLVSSAVLLSLVFLIWRVPQFSVPLSVSDDKERIELENTIRDSMLKIIQTVGGLGFVLTTYFAWKNLKISEDKQVTERFVEAVKMLSDKERLEVRLGGIYSLQRIAKDSAQDRQTIVAVLATFIKENSPNLNPGIAPPPIMTREEQRPKRLKDLDREIQKVEKGVVTPRSQQSKKDIQAALTFITKTIDTVNESPSLDLSGTDLQGLNMREANLKGADLRGANLHGANLKRANLEAANLDRVNLVYADLCGAKLNRSILHCANLSQAFLHGTDLRQTDVRLANFRGVQWNSEIHEGFEPTKWPSISEVQQASNVSPELMKFLERKQST